jgi:hypothetical protein
VNNKCTKCSSPVRKSVHNELNGYESFVCTNEKCKLILSKEDLNLNNEVKSNVIGKNSISVDGFCFGTVVFHQAFPEIKAVVSGLNEKRIVNGKTYIMITFEEPVSFKETKRSDKHWLASTEYLTTNQEEARKKHF